MTSNEILILSLPLVMSAAIALVCWVALGVGFKRAKPAEQVQPVEHIQPSVEPIRNGRGVMVYEVDEGRKIHADPLLAGVLLRNLMSHRGVTASWGSGKTFIVNPMPMSKRKDQPAAKTRA